MTEHIELTEAQKRFIVRYFVFGSKLFDRVESFKETGDEIMVRVTTSRYEGVSIQHLLSDEEDIMRTYLIAYEGSASAIFTKKVKA